MTRKNGYAPLRDYAAIGDGRTVALVSRDGAIDWLALPTVASVPVFARLLDAERGGSFTVEPMGAYEVERRYLPHSNVLETTFRNDDGAVRITDAVTMLDGGLLPWFELARRIECLRGRVRLRYAVDPRFPLSDAEVVAGSEDGTPTWRCRDTELALLAFGTTAERAGQFELREGESALLALVSVQSEPIPRPERDEIETRIEAPWARGRGGSMSTTTRARGTTRSSGRHSR